MRFKAVFILVCILVLLVSGCSSETATSSGLQDPYQAYDLKKGEDNIGKAIHDNPPAVIVFKPVVVKYGAAYAPVEMDEITLKRGEKASFNLASSMVTGEQGDSKTEFIVATQVVIDHTSPKDSTAIFLVSHETDYKLVNKSPTKGERVQKEGTMKAESSYTFGGTQMAEFPDKYLLLPLSQKGSAGNVGEIYCQIVSVQLK
jgi:hypothetical protein